mgnify:CR=1 FL=1
MAGSSFAFQCKNCSAKLQVKSTLAGKVKPCPKCGQPITFPEWETQKEKTVSTDLAVSSHSLVPTECFPDDFFATPVKSNTDEAIARPEFSPLDELSRPA